MHVGTAAPLLVLVACSSGDLRMRANASTAAGVANGNEDTLVTGSLPSVGGTTGIPDDPITGGSINTAGGAPTDGVAHAAGSPTTGASTNAGGAAQTGGMANTAGLSIMGGSINTGGTAQTGGMAETGGSSITGGSINTGGVAHTGGSAVTGGSIAIGGAAQTGGLTGSGGMMATGGAPGTGGGPAHRKFVGNITTENRMDALGLRFADYWDQITPESAGKWYAVQPTPASPYDWTTLDAIFDYAVQNSLIFHESPMIWESSVPSGFTADLAHAWIDAFCDRYPTTPIITVVNEPPPHTKPVYADEMGGNTNGDWKWIVTAFQWAHDACPNAILLLNDYNNIEYASDNANTIDIVNAVKAGGGPIHGVGAQAHDAYRIRTATVKAYMDKIHDETGLPVYITEYDVGLADDAAQLAVYQEQLPVFLETDYVPGITQFGWIEGKTWRSNTGLVREDGSFRPAMTWLMETLRRPRIAQAASKKRPMDR